MFGFLNRIRSSAPPRATIEAIYGMIVAQARQPIFYEKLGVSDTVNGRFDMIVLHLWLVVQRLRELPDGEQVAQVLFDHFCADMDGNLREMGVGDLTVPKRMQSFGEAFYGRAAAYDAAFATGGHELADAIIRNLLNGTNRDAARTIASYVAEVHDALLIVDSPATLRRWQFPLPSLQSAEDKRA